MFRNSITGKLRSKASSFLLASSIAVATIAVAGLTESPVKAVPTARGELIAQRTVSSAGQFNAYAGEKIQFQVVSCELLSTSCKSKVGTALDNLQAGDVLTISEGSAITYNLVWSAEFGSPSNPTYDYTYNTNTYTVPNPVPDRLRVNTNGTQFLSIESDGARTLSPTLKRNGQTIAPLSTSDPLLSVDVSANIGAVNGGSSRDVSQYTSRVGDTGISYFADVCVDMSMVQPGDEISWSYAFSGGTTRYSPSYYWTAQLGGEYPGNLIPDPEPSNLKGTFNLAFVVTPGTTYAFSLDVKRGSNSIAFEMAPGDYSCSATALTTTVPVTTTTTPATTTTVPATTTTVPVTPTVPPPALATVQALPLAPTPIVADATISTGEEITVSFGGFTPFEFVQLIVASTPQVIGSGYADAQGVVTLRGNLPSNLASGNHTLAVFAPVSGVGFTQPITVSQPLLPATGSDGQNNLFVIAMLLFVLGIVVRRTSTVITNK
jgi:LPXTG-motif cell wall-anchored protein